MNGLRSVLLAVVALLPLACTPSSDPAPAGAIELGTLVAVSGDLAGTGKDNTDATNLAIEQINAAGGVLGRPLRLVVEDDRTNVEGARAGYTNLIARKVAAVIGPSSSSQVLGIADLIAASHTPTIGRTSTSPLLTALADDDYFFRVAPSDVFQSRVLAALVRESKVERLCIVHREDAYGRGLSDALIQALGGSLPLVRTSYNPTTHDLSFVLPRCEPLRCAAGDGGAGTDCSPDDKIGLVMITYVDDGAGVLNSAPEWSASRQRFFFSDGSRDAELLKLGFPAGKLEGARGTVPSGPDPATPEGELLADYKSAFKARYGAPAPAFSENAFEAVYLASAAIELAGTTDGPAVRDALRRVNQPGGAPVLAGKWAAIRDAIAQKRPINYRGVTGEADFDANGDLSPPYYYRVWRIAQGVSNTEKIEKVTP